MELIQAISEDIGQDIEYYYADIGMMNRMKMKFGNNDVIQQWTDYFIRYDMAIIEELRKEKNRHEERLGELRRTRQGGTSVRTGGEVCERAELFNQPAIWAPYP